MTEKNTLVRSGYVSSPMFRTFSDSGKAGFYWSNLTGPDKTRAYYFEFFDNGIGLSSYYNRFFGFSLRCLAS